MARFFCIFHALSFELNFFFDRRCPLRTFASLTPKYGGSFMGVFTVLTFFERTYFDSIFKKD